MTTDETLFRRYLDGDEGAMRELMERYGDALTLYIAGIIHDINDAEDLMLDAFMRLVLKRPRIWDNCFKAYLYKTARNLALRFAENSRRSISFGFEDLALESEGTELVEHMIQNEERSRILHVCMERLNPDYGEVLYLLYLEGMSYREAAGVMGKTEKQIDRLAQKGKIALRAALEREGITDAHNR